MDLVVAIAADEEDAVFYFFSRVLLPDALTAMARTRYQVMTRHLLRISFA